MTVPLVPDPATWFNGVTVTGALMKADLVDYVNALVNAYNASQGTTGPVASGSASVTVTTVNTDFFTTVTFPTGRFSTAPAVTATPAGTTVAQVQVSVSGISATGFTLHARATTTATVNVEWIAVAAP